MKSIQLAVASMATVFAKSELFLEKAQKSDLVFGPQESLTSEFIKNALLAASNTGSDVFPCQYWVGK